MISIGWYSTSPNFTKVQNGMTDDFHIHKCDGKLSKNKKIIHDSSTPLKVACDWIALKMSMNAIKLQCHAFNLINWTMFLVRASIYIVVIIYLPPVIYHFRFETPKKRTAEFTNVKVPTKQLITYLFIYLSKRGERGLGTNFFVMRPELLREFQSILVIFSLRIHAKKM